MNKIRISVVGMLVLLGLFSAIAPSSTARAQYAVPGCDTATLNGYIETDQQTYVWFQWGEGSSLTNSTPKQSFSYNSEFSQRINNLKENTMYSYRAMSSRDTGETLTFWTNDCGGSTPAQKPVVSFSANPTSMTLPDHFTTLRWDVEGADACWASSSTTPRWWNSNNPVDGFHNSQPIPDLITGNNYFSLRCENSAGSTTKDVTVVVKEQATPPPQPQDTLPKGFLDFASCTEINGWAFGTNYATISVELTDGISSVTARADKNRQDVGDAYPGAGDWHGFKISTPEAFKDFSSKQIHAYALDISGSRVHLGSSPKTIPACKTQVTPPPPQVCQDPSATNYKVSYPCRYPPNNPPPQVCQDPSATNFGGSLPCVYAPQKCQDPNASNYGGSLPCQYSPAPTVDLSADDQDINSGTGTTLRWNTTGNPSSCTASGDWSGAKNVNGSNQPTGTLTAPNNSTRTYTYNINCSNTKGSDFDTVTVLVRGQTTGTTCQDPNATNYGGSLPCQYAPTGQAPDVNTRSATNVDRDEATLRGDVNAHGLSTEVWFEYGRDREDVENGNADDETSRQNVGSGTSVQDFSRRVTNLRENTTYYFRAVGRNSRGTDYGQVLSFRTDEEDNDDDRECTDRNALNYRGSYPCRYPPYVPPITPTQNRPTVIIYADQTSLSYNGATFVRWSTVNATSCEASGGSAGWAGTKSIGPGSFYTGSLSSSRTYTMTCWNSTGSATDSVTVSVRRPSTGGPTPPPPASSLVLVTSSIDRNQPIMPSLDNTRPRPGDEITYTVNYQNIGTGAIKNLVLRLDLPYEVMYRYSTPNNPIISGNTLIFNLGTLPANGSGTVTVRVVVRQDAPPGALLNFPAILSYIDPAGYPQTVTANVSAQVWNMGQPVIQEDTNLLGAAAFMAGGFWPTTLFGWLLLIILVLLLVLLGKYLATGAQPFERKTIIEHH